MNKKNELSFNITLISIVLVIIGIFMVYSASNVWASSKFNDPYYYLKRQSLFALLGMIGFLIFKRISTKYLKDNAFKILLISFILLILVLIPGVGVKRNGSQSWFGIGPFLIQPAELFKIAIVIYCASYCSDNFKKTKNVKGFLALLLMMIIGFTLIMLQPDFGTAMVIILALSLMMFVTKLHTKYFLYLCMSGLFLIVVLIMIAPYRFERIMAFIDPFNDPLGSGFQIIQSLYAIGPGGLFGNGINASYQKHFFLPEPQTDFIFAIIIEEYGLIGGLIILMLFLLLFYYGFKLALLQSEEFNALLIIGLLGLIIVQVIINLGVVISLIPVTGITLPLISYGGSSLSVTLCSLGLITSRR